MSRRIICNKVNFGGKNFIKNRTVDPIKSVLKLAQLLFDNCLVKYQVLVSYKTELSGTDKSSFHYHQTADWIS